MKDAPAFDLITTLQSAARLSAELGVKVRVSKHGAVTIDPPTANNGQSTSPSAVRMRRKRERDASDACDACDASDAVTTVTLVTQCDADVTQSLPPPLPLPRTPSPTPPPTGHPSPRAREWPSLEQVKAEAKLQMLTEAEAEAYWLAREASDWVRSSNGSTTPVGNWKADLKAYTNATRQRAADEKNKPRYGRPKASDYDIKPSWETQP